VQKVKRGGKDPARLRPAEAVITLEKKPMGRKGRRGTKHGAGSEGESGRQGTAGKCWKGGGRHASEKLRTGRAGL